MSESERPWASSIGFAESDEEAAKRYGRWKSADPFPEIQPALLNSGDIADYVAATGMVYPFRLHDNSRKPASYEVPLLGECVTFTGPLRDSAESSFIGEGDVFVLRENEIAFVGLEPRFRLPEYIALRFNLKITHVYKGLLLGTGPLVDPGFDGYLWIPLHNLTANEYHFRGGEGLVWMEFTKVSLRLPEDKRGPRQEYFQPFPPEKNEERKEIMDYLTNALRRQPNTALAVRSSIPVLFRDTKDAAAKAADQAEKTAKHAARVGTIVTIGGIAALLTILISVFSLVLGVRDRADEALREVGRLEERVQILRESPASRQVLPSVTPRSPTEQP